MKYILLLLVLSYGTIRAQSHCGIPPMYITAVYDKHGKLIPRDYPILLTGDNTMTPTQYKKWKRKQRKAKTTWYCAASIPDSLRIKK